MWHRTRAYASGSDASLTAASAVAFDGFEDEGACGAGGFGLLGFEPDCGAGGVERRADGCERDAAGPDGLDVEGCGGSVRVVDEFDGELGGDVGREPEGFEGFEADGPVVGGAEDESALGAARAIGLDGVDAEGGGGGRRLVGEESELEAGRAAWAADSGGWVGAGRDGDEGQPVVELSEEESVERFVAEEFDGRLVGRQDVDGGGEFDGVFGGLRDGFAGFAVGDVPDADGATQGKDGGAGREAGGFEG